MTLYIDADACPVKAEAERVADLVDHRAGRTARRDVDELLAIRPLPEVGQHVGAHTSVPVVEPVFAKGALAVTEHRRIFVLVMGKDGGGLYAEVIRNEGVGFRFDAEALQAGVGKNAVGVGVENCQ